MWHLCSHENHFCFEVGVLLLPNVRVILFVYTGIFFSDAVFSPSPVGGAVFSSAFL